MKPKNSWAEQFRISPLQIEEWQEIAPPDVPLPFWAVEQGHIDSAEYLEWAREKFELPILADQFFESEMLPKVEGDWQPWLMPVGEWDGILFVACAEPPTSPEDQKWPKPVQFVLASPHALSKAWSSPAPEMPDGLKVVAPKKVRLSLDLDNLEAAAPAQPVVESAIPSSQASDSPSVSLEADEDRTVVTLSNILHDVELPDDVELPEIPSVRKETITSVRKLNLSGSSDGKLPPAPKSMQAAKNLEEAFAFAFASIADRYTHIMTLQETGHQMVPYVWTPNWKAPKGSLTTRANSLDQPSLFRIAGKTRRPYHGFIVESDIHKEFFTAWGFDSLPACATAVPIVVQDEVWGLLLCVGNESSESPEALRLAEKTADDLADYIRSHAVAA